VGLPFDPVRAHHHRVAIGKLGRVRQGGLDPGRSAAGAAGVQQQVGGLTRVVKLGIGELERRAASDRAPAALIFVVRKVDARASQLTERRLNTLSLNQRARIPELAASMAEQSGVRTRRPSVGEYPQRLDQAVLTAKEVPANAFARCVDRGRLPKKGRQIARQSDSHQSVAESRIRSYQAGPPERCMCTASVEELA
jgi:hypothetical protein